MSLKMKLTASISAFFLVVGLMLIGIMAVNQATVNMGGSISFTATDVYARVTGKIENAQGEYANKELPTLEFSAENDTPDQSGWSNLNLLFDDDATPIEVTITVENLSAQNTLRVNLNDKLSSTIENFEKVVQNDGETYTNHTDITLQPNGQENDSTTFTIIMSITNKNNSLTADFDYELNLFDQYYVETYDYFTFKENGDGTVELTAFDKEKAPSTDIVIPATVSQNESGQWTEGDTYKVTDIFSATSYRNGVFYNSGITSIELPATLETIGSNAFRNCSGLTGALDLSNCTSLTSIRVMAFYGCSGLTGELDFSNCTSLTSIGDSAFYNCSRLTSITLPSSLTSIGDYAFWYCSGLTGELDFSNCTSLTSIGDSAFYNCSRLTSITLPSSLTSIERFAFSHCSGLTEVDLSQCTSLTSIGDSAFNSCSGLTELDFSNCTSLTSIERYAFKSCSKLTSIDLSQCTSLISIGDHAFDSCSGLTEIDLSNCTSLISIGSGVFYDCINLARVIFPNTTGWYRTTDDAATDGDSMDMSKPEQNATWLTETYRSYYFKRNA